MLCKLQIHFNKQRMGESQQRIHKAQKKPLRLDSILTELTKIPVTAAKTTTDPLQPGRNWLLAQPFDY